MHVEWIEFAAAKLRVAEILARHDLIKERGGEQHQATGEADYSHRAVAKAPIRRGPA